MPNIPIEDQKRFIKEYSDKRESYELYAKVLEEILKKVRDLQAPLGFVTARAKTVLSFSEKIIRKDKYKNPLVEMTDLCGARVICHFKTQVEDVSNFIKTHFKDDPENSVDPGDRLRIGEFGYRAVHYIVTLEKEEILGVEIPEEIRTLKAEIQVRTLNEHTWADIAHDRIYKTQLKVPKKWERESARLAAMLEKADNSFSNMSQTLDKFSISYKPTPSQKKLNTEIELLKTLISLNEETDEEVLEMKWMLSALYNTTGNWSMIIDTLEPIHNICHQLKNKQLCGRIKYELGYAIFMKGFKEDLKSDQDIGIAWISESLKLFADNRNYAIDIAKAADYLANIYTLKNEDKEKILELKSKAYHFCPENPYYRISSIINLFLWDEEVSSRELEIIKPQLTEILSTLNDHREMGIESANAFLFGGICNFLSGNFEEAVFLYLDFLKDALQDEITFSIENLDDSLRMFEKISHVDKVNAQILMGIIKLLKVKKFKSKKALADLGKIGPRNSDLKDRVLLVAGDSEDLDKEETSEYGNLISEALLDFNGTVISGGTASGVPGLVGSLTATAGKKDQRLYNVFGYLPGELKHGIKRGQGYNAFIETPSNSFTYLEVLSYWADILLNNTEVENIYLLGLNGGSISEMEYKTALVLAARVILVGDLGGAAKKITEDPEWNNFPNLFATPNDPYTIWALMNQNRETLLSEEQVDKLAKQIHEDYKKTQEEEFEPDTDDINKYKVIMEWDKLDPKLQISNKKQAEFIEHIYSRVGLKIRPSENPVLFKIPDKLKSEADYEKLGRLEHARWNAERLLAGWKYGLEKDISNKINPCLVKWDDLDAKTQQWDFDPVVKWPEYLKELGFEVILI